MTPKKCVGGLTLHWNASYRASTSIPVVPNFGLAAVRQCDQGMPCADKKCLRKWTVESYRFVAIVHQIAH